MLEKTGFASGDGRRERRPSQLVPQAPPFLGWLSASLLPPQALPVRVTVPPPGQVRPQPHSQGECGISLLRVNRLPKEAQPAAAGSGLLSSSVKTSSSEFRSHHSHLWCLLETAGSGPLPQDATSVRKRDRIQDLSLASALLWAIRRAALKSWLN